MGLNLTSELEGVNKVLRMMGESPVNSLESQFGLAKQAHDSLREASRAIQSEGWSFNTDFEKTLNEEVNKKIKLAKTGTARPNARSSQDGVNKSYNDYYKVRYVYAEDEFLKNKTGQERPFCKKMMEANKIYRKEDILQMSNMVVNDYYYSTNQKRNIGWGANGDLKYSIWLYKG